MLNTYELLDAMTGIEAETVWETGELLGYAQPRPRGTAARRFGRTALIAAVIAALMGLTALAVGMSIHQRRQQELRRDLAIDRSAVGSYTEYPVPAEETAPVEGVTLLSTINDGDFQKIFMNVSPVTEEELKLFPGGLSFTWGIDGSEHGGFAAPALPSDLSVSGDEIYPAVRQHSYDPDTRTLTIVAHADSAFLAEAMGGKDSVPLRISMWEGDRLLRSFGPVDFTPTEAEKRVFDFGGLRYYDAELDKEIELVALELTPISAVWRVRYEGDAEFHRERNQEKLNEWGRMEDRVCEAVIRFADGSEFCTGGPMTVPYENGTVNLHCAWGRAIDINAVTDITLGDLTLWEAGA